MYNLDNLLNHRLLIQSNSSKVQYWQLIDIPRPISSYCFYKDICPSPNLYPNLLQLPILHLYGLQEDQIMKLVKTSLTRVRTIIVSHCVGGSKVT